jgi:methyl-accepting chemotaxis protein
MSFLSISNWPFSVKFIAPASLAVVVMVGMGVYSVKQFDKQVAQTQSVVEESNATMEEIVKVNFMGSSQLSKIASDVQGLNGKFYEILTRESAQLNKDGPGDMRKLSGDAKKILSSLQDYNDKYATPDQIPVIDGLIEDMTQNFTGKNNDGIFIKAADMMVIDMSLVFQGIGKYQETYSKTLQTIATMSDENIKTSLENSEAVRTKSTEKSNEIKNDAEITKNHFIIVLGLIIATVALFGILVSRVTVSSIRKISVATDTLSTGDTNVNIDELERKDELKSIVSSLRIFKENSLQIQRLEIEQKQAEEKIDAERREAMEALAQDFDDRTSGIIQALTEASVNMQKTAETVDNSSKMTSKSSEIVAQSVAEADNSVKTASHASDELALSSREIAVQITHVAEQSNKTSATAEKTSEQVSELNRLAISIDEIVGAIRGIAEQTNLLALNATIEAARAGEAGKGFAVVADEVKKLATETTIRTEEIGERVNKIQSAVRNTVEAVSIIIEDVRKIDHATSSVAGAVEEQNAATSEIGRNVAQISEETGRVSGAIREVLESSRISTEAANSALSASHELGQISEMLRNEVSTFLSEIRSSAKKSAA